MGSSPRNPGLLYHDSKLDAFPNPSASVVPPLTVCCVSSSFCHVMLHGGENGDTHQEWPPWSVPVHVSRLDYYCITIVMGRGQSFLTRMREAKSEEANLACMRETRPH